MKTYYKKLIAITSLCLIGLFLASCNSGEKETNTAATQDPFQSIWMESAPENSTIVSKAFEAKPGDTVAVEGVIAGVIEPFSDSFSVFVIADDKLVYCNEMGDDHCSTPWDACCEDPDLLKTSRATVQFISEDGIPFQQSLKGEKGLKELDLVIIKGVVDSNSTPENLIINASGLYQKAS